MDEEVEVGPGPEEEVNPLEVELAQAREELAVVRGELTTSVERFAALMRARPDVVPELIGGGTMVEVEASVTGAQEAFRRIAGQFGGVGAGGGARGAGGAGAGLSPQATPVEILAYAVARQARNVR